MIELRYAASAAAAAFVFTVGAGLSNAQSTRTPVGARDLAQPANVGLGPTIGASEGETITSAEVLLEGSLDEKAGTASLARTTGSGQFRLTLTAPLDQDSGEAVPLTLDGGGPGTKGQLSYSRLSWGGGQMSLAEQQEYTALCRRALGRETCRVTDFTDEGDHNRAEELLHLADAVWFYAARGTFGRTNFKYLDDSLQSHSVLRNDWSFKAFVGRYIDVGFLVGSYSYGRAFSAGGPKRQVCTPLGQQGALECRDAVLAPPIKEMHSVVSLELRRFMAGGLGIAPLVQRDFEKSATAVLFPLYFLRDSKGSLIGGARAGWRSDDQGFTLSIFVGSAMTLTP